jgi:hypothetical protein
MPSPAIATRRPFRCRSATEIDLVLRTYFAVNLIDAQLTRNGLGRRCTVARRHDESNAGAMQQFDRRRC